MNTVSVVIPTYNASSYLPLLLSMLKKQTIEHTLIIIDSASTDDTELLVNQAGGIFYKIAKGDFNHGLTRNIGLELAQTDVVVFMTQDALPASELTLESLVDVLNSREDIAMAYGRQIPYPDTGIFGRFARIENYPPNSIVKTHDLIPKMGIKTCSCSNSFAAYFKDKLKSIGSFPSENILGEDVTVGARFILEGKAIAYVAEAEVYHSHDYTIAEEFQRYFDIGVFHYQQRHLLSRFSKSEEAGFKYVLNEWKYLIKNGVGILIGVQVVRTISKYIGYKLGLSYKMLPNKAIHFLSMHKSFWI